MRGGPKISVENVFNIFNSRGFIEQVTDKDQVRGLLENATTCYIGFDPTAKSLHVGSVLPIMSLVHMQRAGHKPIIVIGSGTALVGDPSGKTERRLGCGLIGCLCLVLNKELKLGIADPDGLAILQ